MHKPLVLCPHQAKNFQYARAVGKLPPALKELLKSDASVENWVYGLRTALSLASDCFLGKRLTTECMKYGDIACQVADAVLERRGPEITEHDTYTESLSRILDEVPCNEDDT